MHVVHVVVADDQLVRNVDVHETPPSVAVATHVCHVLKAESRLVVNDVAHAALHVVHAPLNVTMLQLQLHTHLPFMPYANAVCITDRHFVTHTIAAVDASVCVFNGYC